MSYDSFKGHGPGAFSPAANSNKSQLCFSEDEESRLHHMVRKYGGTIGKSEVGDVNRIDIFLTAEEKAFGRPAMTVTKRPLRENQPLYTLLIGPANIESNCFLQTTVTLDKFIRENCMSAPRLVSEALLSHDKL